MSNQIAVKLHQIKTIENRPLITIKAKTGENKGYFIIDTGAQTSIISDAISGYTHKELTYVNEVLGITNEKIQNVKMIELYEVKIGKTKINIKPCFVLNITHIQKAFKPKYLILGLLGFDFLSYYKANIDLKNKKLILRGSL